ncbi:MAG: hypothetical protein M3352_00845 [Bacteroidota bacterium]|nr:hypothetical protein [Bacteroidota bacterium]
MKILKIVGHPVLIMSMFLLILISGEAFGGPYLLYLILGLPHGTDHAIVGFLGLFCLFTSYKIYRNKKEHWSKPALALMGMLGLLFSLYIFFSNDKMRYNYSTFEQTVPLFSLALFGLCIICGLIINGFKLIDSIGRRSNTPMDTMRST